MNRGSRFVAAILVLLLAVAASCARRGGAAASGDAPTGDAASDPSSVQIEVPLPEPTAVDRRTPERSQPIERPAVVMRSVAKESPPGPATARPDTAIPSPGEAIRPPRDYAIGPLGSPGDHVESYRAAVDYCRALAAGTLAADAFHRDGAASAAMLKTELSVLGPGIESRVGSPATPQAGSVSYLVRFLGAESSLSGEIQLRVDDAGHWLVDALFLDYPSPLSADGASFDPLVYKRFL